VFRKILFWSHLVVGIGAAVGIVVLCFTGVLLTYERQISQWAASSNYVPVAEQGERLPLAALISHAEAIDPEVGRGNVVLDVNPGAPVVFRAGVRGGGLEINPYTGEQMHTPVEWVETFFRDMTGWHRWFNFSADDRAIPRQIIGVSNILFLFLIVSGLYLWFPAVWKWATFRMRLLFHKNSSRTAKARDFVWHHVFGFWCAIPLAVLAISGSMFSYNWTDRIVYGAFGTEPPGRPVRGGGAGRGDNSSEQPSGEFQQSDEWLNLDALVVAAQTYIPGWQEITLTLPRPGQESVSVLVDRGSGGQPQLRDTLTMDRRSGEVTDVAGFDSLPLNQRIRGTNRFLHTGEYLGVIGQTVAGLVSLFALIMVWTGLALAWRRLVTPLIASRQSDLDGSNSQEALRT